MSVSVNGRIKTTFIKRVMMFVDGGYLRSQMEENLVSYKFLGDEEKPTFAGNVQAIYNKSRAYLLSDFKADLIRIYYYDGHSDYPKHENIREYHDKLRNTLNVEVKTIPMVKSSKLSGYKQKGIDTLIAIDMLSKAYGNHYDVAFLLTGDSDLIPVIDAVKNDAGKNVRGIYFESAYSDDLKISFDSVYPISKQEAITFLL